MWVYFRVDWTNLEFYVILQLIQILLAYYNKINVKYIYIYIYIFFLSFLTLGARGPLGPLVPSSS